MLTVSHVDAEDLVDRIRDRLISAGMIGGPALGGPGWAIDRSYQTGDRVLLHTRVPRHHHLVNGATATVTAVDPAGLTVRLANGDSCRLPAGFVAGRKPDGSPKLSHSWARTIDGAQGGTWETCHLLGTAALDAYRGYTGQSRSRQPTHTWNTTPVLTVDHGGVLADQRTPDERVAPRWPANPTRQWPPAATRGPSTTNCRPGSPSTTRSSPPNLSTGPPPSARPTAKFSTPNDT